MEWKWVYAVGGVEEVAPGVESGGMPQRSLERTRSEKHARGEGHRPCRPEGRCQPRCVRSHRPGMAEERQRRHSAARGVVAKSGSRRGAL